MRGNNIQGLRSRMLRGGLPPPISAENTSCGLKRGLARSLLAGGQTCLERNCVRYRVICQMAVDILDP